MFNSWVVVTKYVSPKWHYPAPQKDEIVQPEEMPMIWCSRRNTKNKTKLLMCCVTQMNSENTLSARVHPCRGISRGPPESQTVLRMRAGDWRKDLAHISVGSFRSGMQRAGLQLRHRVGPAVLRHNIFFSSSVFAHQPQLTGGDHIGPQG